MKKKLYFIISLISILLGIFLLLYPVVSNHINQSTQSLATATYEKTTNSLADERKQALRDEAARYNEQLIKNTNRFILSKEEYAEYNQKLNPSETGIMAVLTIPAINVELPIYHGVDKGVLQVAIGHLPGSSLPVGGPSTHCVLTGHSGLPSARLLTDLDRLVLGDRFMLTVLDETHEYEVDQIVSVLPNELDQLNIQKDADLCTLVTCTPYGVNTHRLLIRGHRVATQPIECTEGTSQQENSFLSFCSPIFFVILAFVIALAVIAFILLKRRRYRNKYYRILKQSSPNQKYTNETPQEAHR